jgi:imidazole glycerol-phosphate synthase subunit HisH
VTTVVILDHALARARRLQHALVALGVEAKLTDTPRMARQADVLVVPDGDDHDDALSRGVSPGVFDAIAEHVRSERPLLCIGLGTCFLLSGRTHPAMPEGLGLFQAPVQRFDPRMADEGERPLLAPHVGNALVVGLDRHQALKPLVPKGEPGLWFSFRHRLCAPARIPRADVAIAHHGVPFAAAIWRGSQILALQFLPELSGRMGLNVLRTFFTSAGLLGTRPPP